VKWVARIAEETEQERRAREEQSERAFVKLAETDPEWAEKERRVYEHLMTTNRKFGENEVPPKKVKCARGDRGGREGAQATLV
jgi:hypothetical protein